MNRYTRLAGIVAVGIGMSACSDFLVGPGVSENPNQPIVASTDQLFIAMQARQFVLQEGQLARQSAIWTQQLSGIFNQQKEWGSAYNVTENDIQGHYAGFYVGGGLVDLRKIQSAAQELGNNRLVGIAKIWEGFSMGTATSLWGDLPYREAVSADIQTPALDPQQQIYADVQKVLDEGIAALSGGSSAAMPTDLVYNGNVDRWRRAANTLKARYHLHTAPRVGQAAYQAALAAANQGINEAPTTVAQAVHGQAPGDFRAFHGNTDSDANIWEQFIRARSDLAGNERFISVLRARTGDPRLEGYFDPASDGAYRGANQFGLGEGPWSDVDLTTRRAKTFRQPLVTWTENQLIIAEAQFRLGNQAAALEAVNRVRTALGMPALAAPITLEQIMVEKWIAQFQNIDAYADFRRTCFPRLQPGGSNPAAPAARVPGRLPYGGNERLQNPNVPPPSQQPADVWAFAETASQCPTAGGTI